LTVTTVKCSHIQDGGGRHPKNKNDSLDRHDRLKFEIFKMAAAAMLKIEKMS